MRLIKEIGDLRNLRLSGAGVSEAILLLFLSTGHASAESCLAPIRPYVPGDARAARDYADLIRRDFELYESVRGRSPRPAESPLAATA